MLYIEYLESKNNFERANKNYTDLIDIKERLFIRTLPGAIEYKEDKIESSIKSNPFENYIIKKEEIDLDKKIEEAKSILKNREKIYRIKKEELINSKDWNDIIFTYYYLKKFSIRKTTKYVPFSKTEVSRKIQKIKKSIIWDKRGQK